MIEIDQYDIAPPPETIRTDAIAKPEPESDPVDIWEVGRVLDTSGVGGGKDKGVLFSGGDDSLALTHLAMEQGWADFVVHLATNSELPENIDYVRCVCERHNWPLFIISSPMPLDIFAYRYSFPGSQCHTMAFHSFKGRQLAYFYRRRSGGVKFFSGVRKLESDRRMENITAEVQYEDASDGGNFTGWWVSPLIDKSDQWVRDYREQHDLSRNPIAEQIHRSGDCHCLAYGHRDEELTLLEAEYPEFAEWLLNVETRVQEYRGRVLFLDEQYTDVAADVDERRRQSLPYPMRLTVLKESFPDVYKTIVAIERETAILKGQTEATNFIGHGGLSSHRLRELQASADACQETLCETCQAPADSLASSVERSTQRAASELEDRVSQQSLPIDVDASRTSPVIEDASGTSSLSDSTTQVTLLDDGVS